MPHFDDLPPITRFRITYATPPGEWVVDWDADHVLTLFVPPEREMQTRTLFDKARGAVTYEQVYEAFDGPTKPKTRTIWERLLTR